MPVLLVARIVTPRRPRGKGIKGSREQGTKERRRTGNRTAMGRRSDEGKHVIRARGASEGLATAPDQNPKRQRVGPRSARQAANGSERTMGATPARDGPAPRWGLRRGSGLRAAVPRVAPWATSAHPSRCGTRLSVSDLEPLIPRPLDPFPSCLRAYSRSHTHALAGFTHPGESVSMPRWRFAPCTAQQELRPP